MTTTCHTEIVTTYQINRCNLYIFMIKESLVLHAFYKIPFSSHLNYHTHWLLVLQPILITLSWKLTFSEPLWKLFLPWITRCSCPIRIFLSSSSSKADRPRIHCLCLSSSTFSPDFHLISSAIPRSALPTLHDTFLPPIILRSANF